MAAMDSLSSWGPQAIGPVPAADGPGAKADGSQVKIGVAESAKGSGIKRCHNLKIDDFDELQVAETEILKTFKSSGFRHRRRNGQ